MLTEETKRNAQFGATISEFNNHLDAIEGSFQNNAGSTSENRRLIEDLSSQVSILRHEIVESDDELQEMRVGLKQLTASVDALQSRIDALSQRYETLQGSIEDSKHASHEYSQKVLLFTERTDQTRKMGACIGVILGTGFLFTANKVFSFLIEKN